MKGIRLVVTVFTVLMLFQLQPSTALGKDIASPQPPAAQGLGGLLGIKLDPLCHVLADACTVVDSLADKCHQVLGGVKGRLPAGVDLDFVCTTLETVCKDEGVVEAVYNACVQLLKGAPVGSPTPVPNGSPSPDPSGMIGSPSPDPSEIVGSPSPDPSEIVGSPSPDLGEIVGSPSPDPGEIVGSPSPDPGEIVGSPSPDPSEIVGSPIPDLIRDY